MMRWIEKRVLVREKESVLDMCLEEHDYYRDVLEESGRTGKRKKKKCLMTLKIKKSTERETCDIRTTLIMMKILSVGRTSLKKTPV